MQRIQKKYEVEAYSDTSYVSSEGIHNVSGYVIKVNNTTILYKIKKHKLVSARSTIAEFLACSLVIKELKWMKIKFEFLSIKLN
eukprot:snap_masked-scaffold_26-processed-gene-4.51-mRNA-1 protein AED:1.00 eAED:1.00 QI:0/-1/0/0/-1/1/1/0/83